MEKEKLVTVPAELPESFLARKDALSIYPNRLCWRDIIEEGLSSIEKKQKEKV